MTRWYWFSPKQLAVIRDLCTVKGEEYFETRIPEGVYTECTDHDAPGGEWDDYALVGTKEQT